MSFVSKSIHYKEPNNKLLSRKGKPSAFETNKRAKIKLTPLYLPQHTPSNQWSTTETKGFGKKKTKANSILKHTTLMTETLRIAQQRSVVITKDNKNYRQKCQVLLNRIENLKKQESEIIKKMSKINQQKVSSAQLQVERAIRCKKIAMMSVEKEKIKLKKKEKAKKVRSNEVLSIKTAAQTKIENKKKKYDEKKQESKRASSQILRFKQYVEENNKQYCSKIRNNSADLNQLRDSLRQSKEERRLKNIEETIDKEVKSSESLRKKLAQLEKEEGKVFQHLTKTKQQKQLMLQLGCLNSSFSNHKAIKCQGKTFGIRRTKSEESVDEYEESVNTVKLIEDRYKKKIKELNSLIEAEREYRTNSQEY